MTDFSTIDTAELNMLRFKASLFDLLAIHADELKLQDCNLGTEWLYNATNKSRSSEFFMQMLEAWMDRNDPEQEEESND